MTKSLEPVACVGAGNVGRAWAIVFARAGHPVRLYDADPAAARERALPMIRRNLDDLQAAGLIEDPAAIERRIEAVDSLDAALRGVAYVQESVKEDPDVKRALFVELDRLAPRTAILASSTSAISGSRFMEGLTGRGRCLVAHPVNPPYLIPLVEICATPWTEPDVTVRCREFMASVGQTPITVNGEVAGFILNRLQVALVGEALHLVAEGRCTVADIDKVLTDGLARRWAFIGPFEVGHLNATDGFAGYMRNYGTMFRTLAADARVDYPWDDRLVAAIHEEMTKRTPVARVPERQAWRDRRLMAIARHLAETRDDDDPPPARPAG